MTGLQDDQGLKSNHVHPVHPVQIQLTYSIPLRASVLNQASAHTRSSHEAVRCSSTRCSHPSRPWRIAPVLLPADRPDRRARARPGGRSPWRTTAWSPPATRSPHRSGSTCSRRAATRSMRPSPPTPRWALMEPMSCGIGGDLFAIVWDAKTQKLYGLNASGRAPCKATLAVLQGQGAEGDPDHRPAAAGRSPAASTAGTSCAASSARCRSRTCSPRASTTPRRAFPVPRGHRRLLARRSNEAEGRRMRATVVSARTASAPRAGEVFKNPTWRARTR